jgi:hypothetical protein
MLEIAPAQPGPLKDEQERKVMKGSRRRRGRLHQGSIHTLELLRQASDGTLLFDDLEDGGVPLLLDPR